MKTGRRPGTPKTGGIQKGTKHQATIDKALHREALRQIVVEHLKEMTEAQIHNAKGIHHLMLRDRKTGKFERVASDTTDRKVAEAQIDAALASGNAVYMFTKDPSIQAFADLLNRALDKPAEQEQEIKMSGTLVIKWQDET